MNEVEIVAVTTPLIEGITSADEFIAYCARVSNPANQMNTKTAPKLIKFCANNGHWSVFEMVHVVMCIKTTRDIGRQILRHRSFSFQEFSQRYAMPTINHHNTVVREARLQDAKNRQNSIENVNEGLAKEWVYQQKIVADAAHAVYDWAIKSGIAKEQARVVLPEGLTMSTMYMSGSLRSFIHWIKVRHHPATQKEHRLIAANASGLLMSRFPSICEFMTEMILENYKEE